MNPVNDDTHDLELTALVERVLDAGTEEDWSRLAQILGGSASASASARETYVRYVHLRAILLQRGVASSGEPALDDPLDSDAFRALDESMVLPSIRADRESPAAVPARVPVPVPVPAPRPEQPRPVEAKRVSPVRWRMAAAILLAIGLAGIVGYFGRRGRVNSVARDESSPSSSAATLTRAIGATWGADAPDANAGTELSPGKRLNLREGYVELTFRSGAKATVSAPASFTVTSSNALDLSDGELAATVPGAARGFCVQTGNGTITDLGTEFGVRVEAGGSSHIDVFRGTVRVVPLSGVAAAPSGDGRAGAARLLTAGQAARVSAGAVTADPGGAMSSRYVRDLDAGDKTLSLVDLMAGGDGTGMGKSVAVDANSGQVGDLEPVGETAGDHAYHRITASPALDGSFIPDGSLGPAPVDSANDLYQFPVTTNHSFNRIEAGGGGMRWPAAQERLSAVLGGVDYTAAPHGAIAVHSNQGVTFNLDAVRRLHPGTRIARFRAAVGNTYTTSPSIVDVYLLVDGKSRFERRGLTHADGPLEVRVPLSESDHFLTLVTTDGNRDIWGDWAVWGDPSFDLVGK